MKYLRYFIFIFIMFLIVGCKTAEEKEWERVDNLCNEVTFDTVRQLIKAHEELQFFGMGGGGVDGINLLTVHFESKEEISIEKSRVLILECAERFLENINKSEKLRPVLKNFPFQIKNIEVSIVFHPNNRTAVPPNLSIVDFDKGEIIYYISNEKLETVMEESYEKALEIVKKQSELLDIKRE